MRDWGTTCESCAGPLNRYPIVQKGRPMPSRKTVPVSGKVEMETGTRVFKEGDRIEVCYRCYRRWTRGSFLTRSRRSRALTEMDADRFKLLLDGGLSLEQVARAFGATYAVAYHRAVQLGLHAPTSQSETA